ncbi:hypothetical protein JOC77_001953 [Peribacillus deserti]|uniref:Uncharacterized protein n=1 Tax=Peribacillus deserti TaxID=673318 RepID=A0ABS2QH99_9BACI|nr:hypothetical protein [Peribacillus deserti]MBM7692523.1 hypothetical protein [Peribacillus deserti]
MFKKILKSLLGGKSNSHFSSSDKWKHKHSYKKEIGYGAKHYKKKKHSSLFSSSKGFFSS